MRVSLRELGDRLGGRVTAEPEREVTGLATLEEAGPSDLSFLTHPRFRSAAQASAAGALLVGPDAPNLTQPQIVVAEPYVALADLLELFFPEEETAAGVYPTAVVGEDVELGEDVRVGPYAVIGARVRVGARVEVGAGSNLGSDSTVGADSRLFPGAVLYDRTIVGERCILHAGCVLGSDGFGFATDADGRHHKLRHVGRVVIEDDVEIGANTTIDRGLITDTRIAAGTKIDNLVQVAHNVEIGAGSLLAAQSGIAGSSRLGARVVLAGQSGVVGHLELTDDVQVAAKSAVMQSVQNPGMVAGSPAIEAARWRRQQAWLRRLESLGRRVRRLERSLEGIEGYEKKGREDESKHS